MKTLGLGFVTIVFAGLTCQPAAAWYHAGYRGTWLDPTSGQIGNTVDLSGKVGTTIDKPDSKGWFLLLRAPRS